MKFTILPDMEAKRENLQHRKKERNRRKFFRQEKRRKQYLAKKETFWTLFLKRWIVFLVISALLCVAGTIFVERSAHAAVCKEYELWVKGIVNSADSAIKYIEDAQSDLSDEEKLDTFCVRVQAGMLAGNFPELYDFSATLYDVTPDEDGIIPHIPDVVCDSRREFIMRLYSYDGAGNDITYHRCPSELFGDLADDIAKEDAADFRYMRMGFARAFTYFDYFRDYYYESTNSHWIWGMQDYYVKENEFRPGVVWVGYTNQDNITIRDTVRLYDLTPADVSGWTHIDEDVEHDKRYAGEYPTHTYMLYTGGTKEGSRADQQSHYCRAVTYKDGETGLQYGIGWRKQDYRTKLEMDAVRMPDIKWESMGKKYTLITYGYYDFYARHMDVCIKVYCTAGVLATLLSLLMAGLRWRSVKMQLEMEAYRKSITDAMAHDLKSPLMAISGYAENLKANIHTDKKEDYADSIMENVSYMNDIIEHILELSKTETRGVSLNKEALEISLLLDEILDKYAIAIEEKKLNIDINGSCSLHADRQLIAQAIDNLISNAVKFAVDESTIHMECDKNSMIISNRCKTGENKDLDIADMLKPFVKGDSSRSNKSGSGIGLTIAKNIFDLHGYTMKLTFKENTFTVKISF